MPEETATNGLHSANLIRRSLSNFARRMRALRNGQGVSPSKMSALGRLYRAKRAMSASELATKEGLQPQSLTRIVADLEALGLIERKPNDDDRRQIDIIITGKGVDVLINDARHQTGWLAEAITERLTQAEQAILSLAAELLDKISDQDSTREIAHEVQAVDHAQRIDASVRETHRFQKRRLDRSIFNDCSMQAAQFIDINLSEATFTDINLRGARFSNVNLSGVAIKDARIDGLSVLGHDIPALIDMHFSAMSQGAEIARPFVPAKDFALSKSFYEALGFRKILDQDVAIFGVGDSSFILQNYFHAAMAGHFMMQLMVDNLDDWWRKLQALDLAARFGVEQPRPPKVQSWGLRVAFVTDPSGVLWHFAEKRPE